MPICIRSVLTPKEKQEGTATNSDCSRTDNVVLQNPITVISLVFVEKSMSYPINYLSAHAKQLIT